MQFQIIKLKLRENLAREKAGDSISASLSFLDIINLLSYVENIKIENKRKIIGAWNYLYGQAVEEAFVETTQNISKKEVYDTEESEDIKNKEEIKMERFNKKFKNIYLENEKVINAKRVIESFIKKYRPVLYNYLNKEKIIEITTAPKNIMGDIAYLSY